MNTQHFDETVLKLVKLLFEYGDLRDVFMSTDLFRFLSDDISRCLKKIFNVEYFKGTKIDLKYIKDKAEPIGLDSVYLTFLFSDLEKISVEYGNFWIIVDEVKAKFVKTQIIPVILTEYEAILKSDSEIEILNPITKLSETISSILGKTHINIKTEAELKDLRDRLKIYSGEKETSQRRFLTGYKSIDSLLGGFATSEFVVFMGATGSGKTTLLLNLGYQIWITSNVNVMFFSLEMPTAQVLRRLDSRIMNVDYEVLKKCQFTQNKDGVIKELEARTNMFKVIDVPPRTPVTKLEEQILSSVVRPDVIIIDYIGLIGSHLKRQVDRWEVLDEAAMAMKYLAKRYQISVITASQINQDAMKRKDVVLDGYQMYDIAGSKAIGDHSDATIGLQYDENLKIMTFNAPKYRDGRKFSFQLFINPDRCHLYEIVE